MRADHGTPEPASADATTRAVHSPIPAEVPPSVLHDLAPERAVVQEEVARAVPPILPTVDVDWLDWSAIRHAVDPAAIMARMPETVTRLETLRDQHGSPPMMFDGDRAYDGDRAIRVQRLDERAQLWFIGDLHGDLLALEAALALVRSAREDAAPVRLVFLGDLFDDGGYGLEVLLRFFELLLDDPASVCLVAGNHDEALGYNGAHFTATVSPSDFADFLNANLSNEWIVRAGKLAVRLVGAAPRALFFPDGLLVAHGGFPLVDRHADLLAHGNWNDPRGLTDFVWSRIHPKARTKMPNRASRGSQFGHEDFGAFCRVATALGRPVTHMIRGHDHVDERWAIFPAYAEHPVLTTVALSRQLAREPYGPYERVPTIARWVSGALPQVHRLLVPPALVRELYPESDSSESGTDTYGSAGATA